MTSAATTPTATDGPGLARLGVVMDAPPRERRGRRAVGRPGAAMRAPCVGGVDLVGLPVPCDEAKADWRLPSPLTGRLLRRFL